MTEYVINCTAMPCCGRPRSLCQCGDWTIDPDTLCENKWTGEIRRAAEIDPDELLENGLVLGDDVLPPSEPLIANVSPGDPDPDGPLPLPPPSVGAKRDD